MKKKYIILFFFIFTCGFFIGDFESQGKFRNLTRTIDFYLKKFNLIQTKKIISKEDLKELAEVKVLKANSFDLKIEEFLNIRNIKKNSYIKTAAFQMNKIDDKVSYKIFIQNGLKIDNKNIEKLVLPKTIYPEFNGGLKSVFTIEENDYALISNKKKNCVFASIINLTKSVELFKSKCLPIDLINEKPDFNGIGGAVTSIDDDIYLTIGAPESRSEKIRELAQSNTSIFGKVLKISKKDLLIIEKNNLKYSIFSIGHRNPQGIVEINKKIFSTEHGPQGGDELNVIIFGKNYGWPLKSYGTRYDNGKSFKYNNKIKNYQEPIYTFVPSIAPSSLSVCPKNLENYYLENVCLMSLSLREQSLFIILLDNDNFMVQGIEQIRIGKRLRHFAVDSNIKTFFIDNSFFVSTDSRDNLKILKLGFLNFR